MARERMCSRETSIFIVSLVLLSLGLARSAESASFDCVKARSPKEKLICQDGILSASDASLGQVYHLRYLRLSKTGQRLLEHSEDGWLNYVSLVCPLSKTSDASAAASCLEKEYHYREEQLQDVGQRIGPFVFNRIDLFSAHPVADDETGGNPGFATRIISYPQIDNVSNAYEAEWNKNAAQTTVDEACDVGDYLSSYEINLASRLLIALTWSRSFYCHGTPHGEGESTSDNQVFRPRPSPIKVSDLFKVDSAWKQTLQGLFWRQLTNAGWSPPHDNADHVKESLLALVVMPERWILKKDGLSVSYNSYEGGCYACSPPAVKLTWHDLTSVLAPYAVVK